MLSSSRVSAIVVLVLASLPIAARAQVSVQVAQDLYMAADYEGALETLARLEQTAAPGQAAEVARYRLLCLLALGKTEQAQVSAQTLVELAPFAQLSEDDVSPTVRARYDEWRLQRLPTVVRMGYAKAKESYARREYSTAAKQFSDVQRLLLELDEKSKDEGAALADLRVLAADFHQLSVLAAQPKPEPPPPPVAPTPVPSAAAVPANAAAAAGLPPATVPLSPAAAPPPPSFSGGASPRVAASAASVASDPSPGAGITLAGLSVGPPSASSSRALVPEPTASAAAPSPARVYTSTDSTVLPPKVVRQTLPPWPPQLPKSMPAGNRAVLDLVIGADGLVESVHVREGLHPLYDTILLQSARNWRYEPARLNGQAVRYARALELRVQLQ